MTRENPMISVIVPVYNKQRYLNTLIRQLREQSFWNYECILVDDGSSDGSEVICDEAVASDYRFHVLHLVNGGVSRARNMGISAAQGEYITFIDADDELHPDYLENLYRCMELTHADIVIGGYEKFWDYIAERKQFAHPAGSGFFRKEQLMPDFAKVQRDTGIYGYCWAKLFSANLLRDNRFDESLRLAEDFDFYLRLYPRVKTVFLDDKPYYYYRQEAENSSVLVCDDRIDYLSQLRIRLRYREFLIRENAFSDQNKSIIEENIQNYLYFSLFYCPYQELSQRFDVVTVICREYELVPCGQGMMQRMLLGCLCVGWKQGARVILCIYRSLRRLRNYFRGK